ncbi:MAG TPA: hypothetical protein VFN51_03770 [Candidatus Saccharimonadales bacterium]|nr:hypothetical protein [Candidatus Saccharimonadales bacterium]
MTNAVGSIEMPRADTENLNSSEIPELAVGADTLDLGRDGGDNSQKLTEQTDVLPKSHGNLQNLIDRYGTDFSKCPYISSMGEAGIQLANNLVAAESKPDRGPTIRERMEARRKAAATSSSKDNQLQNNKIAPNVDQIEKATIPQTKPAEEFAPIQSNRNTQAIEQASAKIIQEAVTAMEHNSLIASVKSEVKELSTSAEEIIKPLKVAPIIVKPPESFSVKTKNKPHDLMTTPSPLPKSIENMATIKTNQTTPLDSLVRKMTDAVQAPPEDFLYEASIQETPVEEEAFHDVLPDFFNREAPLLVEMPEDQPELGTFSAQEVESGIPEDHLEDGAQFESEAEVFFDDFITESFDPERIYTSNVLQRLNAVDETSMAESIEEISLEITDQPSIYQPDAVSPEELFDENEPLRGSGLKEDILDQIETMEKDVAKEAKQIVRDLENSLHELQIAAIEESLSAKEKVVQVEDLLTQLLKTYEVHLPTEKIHLIVSELMEYIENSVSSRSDISIDLLNYLGTREYKIDSVVAILRSVIQRVQPFIRQYLRLGRQALAASLG